MTPDLWARVCQHFDRLVDLPKDQLQSELEGLQSIDPQLAREVSNLLQGADDESNLPTPLDLPNDAFRALEEYLSRARGTRLPSEIQGYRLGRKLGQGGFGEVYLAELQDERAQVPVAIKILTVSDQHDRVEEARQRFEREGTILQQIPPHAQVIKLLDRGRVGRWPYLILEYVEEARNLRQYCDENQLSIQQRLLLFLRVASVVNYLHHERVLHCDLKPANILVSKEGKVKIIDFGIAKSLRDEEETELTSDPRSRPRTDAYCAPEQARGEPLTVSVDVYSLGVILYELLVGTRPFQSSLLAPVDIVLDPVLKLDELSEERLRDIEKNRDTTIEALKEKLSEQSLRTILTYATHQDPDKRYQTVLELFDDVERYLQGIVPDKLAASFSDVEQRLPVSEPHWLGPRFARSPVRMTILLSLLFTFGPHVIGSVVSIFYNKTLIASGLSPHQASVFERLIWYYNGIMYPIGLAFWLWLVLPIRKTFQQIEQFGTKVEKSRLSLARRNCLVFPTWVIRISALGWFPGAIFFPLGIDLFAEGSISASVYLHFFLSIAISGMIATIYSFFGMQFLTLRVIYPELWRSGRRPEVDAESKSPLTNTQQRIQLFQMGAGMIPLLCAVVLIWTKPRQSFGEAAGNVYNAVHVGMILLGMAGFWLLRGVGDRLNESSREIMQWEMPHPHPR